MRKKNLEIEITCSFCQSYIGHLNLSNKLVNQSVHTKICPVCKISEFYTRYEFSWYPEKSKYKDKRE